MKKIIFILLIVLGFQFHANAQLKEYSYESMVKVATDNDIKILLQAKDLNDAVLLKDLKELITKKNLFLSGEDGSPKRKLEIMSALEEKIKSNFSPQIIEQLKANGSYEILMSKHNFDIENNKLD
jgi:hypothetical protein